MDRVKQTAGKCVNEQVMHADVSGQHGMSDNYDFYAEQNIGLRSNLPATPTSSHVQLDDAVSYMQAQTQPSARVQTQTSQQNVRCDGENDEEEERPFSEYRDFKCKLIGKQMKRPIIRPHAKFQKGLAAEVYQTVLDCKSQKRRKTLFELGYGPKNSVGKLEQMVKSNRDKHMLKILENQMYPDVLVKVGSVTFNCHNILLQSYSTFFKEHFNEPIISLSDKTISPEAFAIVYEWMLESIPLIPREPLMALFNAATVLRIEELIKGCWHCMDADMVHLCEDQAILLYLEGRKYNLKNVQATILQRVSKVFLTFVACREYVEMSSDEVCALLSSNNIGVNTEVEVLLSATRWINHDYDERKQYADQLLSCVRFSLLPAWYLLQLQNETLDCPEFSWIVLSDQLRNCIRKSFMYSVTQQQFGNDNCSFQKWCMNEGIRRPSDRKWIYDKACTYHHRFTCSRLHVITYEMFEEYLANIRKIGLGYWHCIEWSYGGKNDACCCSDNLMCATNKIEEKL